MLVRTHLTFTNMPSASFVATPRVSHVLDTPVTTHVRVPSAEVLLLPRTHVRPPSTPIACPPAWAVPRSKLPFPYHRALLLCFDLVALIFAAHVLPAYTRRSISNILFGFSFRGFRAACTRARSCDVFLRHTRFLISPHVVLTSVLRLQVFCQGLVFLFELPFSSKSSFVRAGRKKRGFVYKQMRRGRSAALICHPEQRVQVASACVLHQIRGRTVARWHPRRSARGRQPRGQRAQYPRCPNSFMRPSPVCHRQHSPCVAPLAGSTRRADARPR